ncbi:MAG: helix-turn-helix transcriptional regulator, partial [Candidatus Acidiferrales bacterium]
DRGLANYQVAARIGVSEARFSRCLNGRLLFAKEEREQIAQVLGYPEAWLFTEPAPPNVRRSFEDSQVAATPAMACAASGEST